MKKPKSPCRFRARQPRDYAAGHRLADAERVADGQHEIADLERIGIADRDHRKRLRRFDLEHGEVEQLVLEQHLALEFAAVGGRDLHIVGIADDVIIGETMPRGSTDAGADDSAPAASAGRRTLEERIAREWRARSPAARHRR